MDFLSPKVGTGSLEITEKRRSELSLDFSILKVLQQAHVRLISAE